MTCPQCDTEVVAFAVSDALRTHAPERTAVASLCPNCLAVEAVDADGPKAIAGDGGPDFSRVHESFPDGDGGVAFALLIGTLPSIALNKESAQALRERAEREGVDVALAFDRLIDAVDGAEIVPEFDLRRRVRQLDSLLDGS
ncbi:DUF6276 family protein [Halobaculum gomorrense]|uniref:Small CPxCG-related zinc finger protein n=1 Tax=Halobaculum gomorrense TaxID=43928 RepID=A0A1M5KEG3_9EURY|nr:DUF6276 family protein [Halobaculum gomorrense]SHG51095.1 hypothetical protein SAMN05443636_0476 [Halobaculum gomorrense]